LARRKLPPERNRLCLCHFLIKDSEISSFLAGTIYSLIHIVADSKSFPSNVAIAAL